MLLDRTDGLHDEIVLPGRKRVVRAAKHDMIVVAPLQEDTVVQGQTDHAGLDLVKPVVALPENTEPQIRFCGSDKLPRIAHIRKFVAHIDFMFSMKVSNR